MMVEAADIFPPLGANRAHRFVGGVVGDLRKDSVVQLFDFTLYQGQKRGSLQPARAINFEKVANGRKNIDLRYQGIEDLPACKAPWPAQNEHHADTVIGQVPLHARKSDTVIGRT